MDKVYHLSFTAEQIEAAVGKGPIIQAVGEDSYWFVWDVAAMQYVQTEYPALIGDLVDITAQANRADAAASRALQSAEESKKWADQAAEGSGAGSGSAEPSELEDYAMEVGQFTNAAAGWCSYQFREAFESVPTVTLQPVNFSGWAEIRNITAEGFQYCLRKPIYTAGAAGADGSVATGTYYTAAGTASSSTHSAVTLVSAVTLPTQPTLPTAVNATTEDPIVINYIAIEYGGER